jgi:hypothetical protein
MKRVTHAKDYAWDWFINISEIKETFETIFLLHKVQKVNGFRLPYCTDLILIKFSIVVVP